MLENIKKHTFLLERILIEFLLEESCYKRQDLISYVLSNGYAQELLELAIENDLDRSFINTVSQICPEQKHFFSLPLDCGGIQGFRKAKTQRLSNEALLILSNFSSTQHKIILVKGSTVSFYYPPHLFRQQNDIDIAVGSMRDLVELYSVMQSYGYISRILAVRLSDANELEGSLSMVRIDQELKETVWCDIWLGVQPVSEFEARKLNNAFWKEAQVNSRDIKVASATESILILFYEITERNILRYRDIFDFLSILENGYFPNKKMLNIDFFNYRDIIHKMMSVINRNKEIIASCFSKWQEFPFWEQNIIDSGLDIKLPAQVFFSSEKESVNNLEPEDAINAGIFTRFCACDGAPGNLAIAKLNSKLVLRTPIGCFISEDNR